MADQFLSKDFSVTTFPFKQSVPFDSTSYGSVPWGQGLLNENFDSQVVTGSDTGTLNIDIKLPSGLVSIPRAFHLQALSTGAISWGDGVVGYAYQNPGGPYKTSVATFPENDYLWWTLIRSKNQSYRDRFASANNLRGWDTGFTSNNTNFDSLNQDNQPWRTPLWIPPQTDANLQQRSVIIYLQTDSATAVDQFTLQATFDLYTLEQAYAAGVMSSPRVF